jgi:hypothetical protein
MTVEFLLFKSLPDERPTVVRREHRVRMLMSLLFLTFVLEELGRGTSVQEVLWNFSRFKDERRLTLKQNPHFYLGLPTSQNAYGGDFSVEPIENFQHAKICVLTDKPGRVFLETDKNRRAFGNLWVPDKAIIFKGSSITFYFPCFLTAFSRRLWKA